MSFYTLERAKAFITQCHIKIAYCDPERPFFVFKIRDREQEVTITKNEKGWMCDGYETHDAFNARIKEAKRKGWKIPTDPWRCIGNTTDCSHIIASKILINDSSLGIDGARYTKLRTLYSSSQKHILLGNDAPPPNIKEEDA